MNDELLSTSIPTLSTFNPRAIPYQMRVIQDVRRNFDYSKGVHEILLSGAVGSAKSILMAHLVVTHCLLFAGAHCGIGRRSMPDLKGTLLATIIAHLADEVPFVHNQTSGLITFPNRSVIRPFSWSDRKFKKFRSYEFSAFAIEELTENEEDEPYREIKMRIGRLTHIREAFLVSATNPGDPTHFAYSRFALEDDEKAQRS